MQDAAKAIPSTITSIFVATSSSISVVLVVTSIIALIGIAMLAIIVTIIIVGALFFVDRFGLGLGIRVFWFWIALHVLAVLKSGRRLEGLQRGHVSYGYSRCSGN